jgi:cellulose synthase/poly-beta-1,6-N-acetylglucosamine synthase-like glycosyltransferase/peptidoglycan/xylan/chitin deacetylase (PgdA/CDA1 family)/spore germination protein YaaH
MPRPIFFDPSGRRRRWIRRGILALLLALVALALAFASTVVTIPAPSPLPLGFERHTPLRLRSQVSRLSHSITDLFRGPDKPRPGSRGYRPITVGFYTTWADEAAPSLSQHIGQLDWVAPTTLAVDRKGQLIVTDDKPLRRILASSIHRPLVVPTLQNVVGDVFSGQATVSLLRDTNRRKAFIARLDEYLDSTGDAGVIFDFEAIPPELMPQYRQLIGETNRDFDKHGRIVGVTVPMGNVDWNPRAFAAVADKVFLMAYDQHWQGGTAGPIAADDWFTQQVTAAMQGVPPGKVVVALGSYAYDWHDGHADGLTVEEAWLAAHDARASPTFLRGVGNTAFSYLDGTHRHDVWMVDAAANWNEMRILTRLGLANVALWRMGSEDPGFWPAVGAWRLNSQPDIGAIEEATNVDVEGNGEILRITATPTPGQREITLDKRTGLITKETYSSLPTPYVVQRTGGKPKMVALTFDDGPDPKWTPSILSILEAYHVPATFFVIGENGVANRSILEREVADGDEIGNHTYTHPNMAQETNTGINLELNATRRLIEAYTGHSIRLFRAPYFGDAEPTTADELGPALIAQQHGYTVVGLHVDPGDWTKPGVPTIVNQTLEQVAHPTPDRSTNIILLHDGGGDRSQTIAALPAIISGLQRAGYQIVPISQLAGLRHDQVMPVLDGVDLAEVRADVWAFTAMGFSILAVNWTFFFAIALGVLRSITMSVLALLPGRAKPPLPDATYRPKVTVIIPCFNEEKVIESSVRRILESSYPYLDVIVADDGSKDRTSEIVSAAFGANPRVKLLTLANGGKAAALNRALKLARGEIIVALDADTQFERETIIRLVRWFVDDTIGAVAGNAKVGNRINLVTRWQAVEYTTAQNIERRALTRFDAIMVVPGAVGAWRREALADVGGYPENTLAEDQDLTIAIQRKGWKIAYDDDAVAWTEAPETFAALAKQRFRWSYGTLQCLWKHRAVVRQGRPSGLAFIGIPQAWLFQIVFAVISPAIDLALVISLIGTVVRVLQHGWAQTQTDVLRMFAYWLAFSFIDLACGFIAYRLDVREKRFPALLLLMQRFVYRQLMYSVVIRAVSSAARGVGTTWGKLERTGRVNAPALVEEDRVEAARVETARIEAANSEIELAEEDGYQGA